MHTVVLDLDGTLLGSDHRVRPKVRSALDRWRGRGRRVILASSRPPRSVARIAADLGLGTEPAVALNGAVVVEGGRLRQPRLVPEKAKRTFLDAARSFSPFIYSAWAWLVLAEDAATDAEARSVGFRPTVIDALPTGVAVEKLSATGAPEALAVLEAAVDDGSLTRPRPGSLELMAPGVSKVSAVAELGLAPDGVVAIGDGDNDAELLAWAELGVAMAGATPTARSAADRVVGDKDTDTLADLLAELGAPGGAPS